MKRLLLAAVAIATTVSLSACTVPQQEPAEVYIYTIRINAPTGDHIVASDNIPNVAYADNEMIGSKPIALNGSTISLIAGFSDVSILITDTTSGIHLTIDPAHVAAGSHTLAAHRDYAPRITSITDEVDL